MLNNMDHWHCLSGFWEEMPIPDRPKGGLTLFAVRYCSPVTAVTGVRSKSSTLSDRDRNGKKGGLYIRRNLPVVLRIKRCVRTGASPYFQRILTVFHHSQPPSFWVKTNSSPFHIPNNSGSSSAYLRALASKPNSAVAFLRIAFTSTNMLAPSSTGSEGSSYALTVVERPPM